MTGGSATWINKKLTGGSATWFNKKLPRGPILDMRQSATEMIKIGGAHLRSDKVHRASIRAVALLNIG
jgi:hypothetical protein